MDSLNSYNLTYQKDELTKTLTRVAITQYIVQLIENKTPFSMLFCDLDYFKNFNDTLGHQIGDEALADFAKILMDHSNVVGRFGGDEFIVILENMTEYDDTWKKCRDICHAVEAYKPKYLNSSKTNLSFSTTIGISRYPKDATDYQQLLQNADKALYRGKVKGRNCFIIYDKQKHSNIKSNEERFMKSEDIFLKIYSIIEKKTLPTSAKITNIFSFLYRYYSLDSISIDNDTIKTNKYVCSFLDKIESLSKYYPLFTDDKVIVLNHRNDLSLISKELREGFDKQDIRASVIVKLEFAGSYYGYLRFDMQKQRVWTNEERAVFVNTAKLISLLMNSDEEL